MANETATLTVWGAGTPRTLRVYWALHELAVPYASVPIRTRTADMDREAFLAVSPGRKIPALQHGDLALPESGAILNYLFDRFDAHSKNAAIRGRVQRWLFFALTELDATALYVMRRHRDLPEIYGAAPAAVTCAADYFARQADVVADELRDARPFIAGEAISVADIALVTCCDWAVAYEVPVPEPYLRYAEALRARPAYTEATRANRIPT